MEKIFIFVLFLLLCGLPYFMFRSNNSDPTRIDVLVVEASIEINNSSEGIKRTKYLYSDHEVFTVEDRLLNWSFDSMTLLNILRNNQGKTCEVKVVGKRLPFFSNYRNVIEVNNCVD